MRAGHRSDLLEVELTARRVPFVKFGGLKFLEAAHVKDFLAGLRLLDNAADEIAWYRLLRLHDGIGPARARELLTVLQLGIRRGRRGSRKRPALGWASLTPTEQSIVDLVAEGLSNPQIGERLYVSRRTVQTHLSHAFTKLAITSRAQLAAEVSRHRPAESTRQAG